MKLYLVPILLIGIIVVNGCYGTKTTTQPSTQPVTTNTVEIKGFAFNPATITIAKGTTIKWMHNDGAPHTVTTTNAPVDFDSGRMNQGDIFTQTFDTAGTYEYYCSIHPNMKGKVIVT